MAGRFPHSVPSSLHEATLVGRGHGIARQRCQLNESPFLLFRWVSVLGLGLFCIKGKR